MTTVIKDIVITGDIAKKFMALWSAGLFAMNSGKMEVNIHNNQIQTIVVHKKLYQRTVGKKEI